MGRRGPAPKPAELKALQGTTRKDRAPANQPQPRIETPKCPTHLKAEARREWRRIIKELEAVPGLLRIVDRAALAAYCQAYERWVEAEKAIREHGMTYDLETKSGGIMPMQRPEVAIASSAMSQMKTFLAEFGMTPASRTRINIQPPKPEAETNPWAELKKA